MSYDLNQFSLPEGEDPIEYWQGRRDADEADYVANPQAPFAPIPASEMARVQDLADRYQRAWPPFERFTAPSGIQLTDPDTLVQVGLGPDGVNISIRYAGITPAAVECVNACIVAGRNAAGYITFDPQIEQAIDQFPAAGTKQIFQIAEDGLYRAVAGTAKPWWKFW